MAVPATAYASAFDVFCVAPQNTVGARAASGVNIVCSRGGVYLPGSPTWNNFGDPATTGAATGDNFSVFVHYGAFTPNKLTVTVAYRLSGSGSNYRSWIGDLTIDEGTCYDQHTVTCVETGARESDIDCVVTPGTKPTAWLSDLTPVVGTWACRVYPFFPHWDIVPSTTTIVHGLRHSDKVSPLDANIMTYHEQIPFIAFGAGATNLWDGYTLTGPNHDAYFGVGSGFYNSYTYVSDSGSTFFRFGSAISGGFRDYGADQYLSDGGVNCEETFKVAAYSSLGSGTGITFPTGDQSLNSYWACETFFQGSTVVCRIHLGDITGNRNGWWAWSGTWGDFISVPSDYDNQRAIILEADATRSNISGGNPSGQIIVSFPDGYLTS